MLLIKRGKRRSGWQARSWMPSVAGSPKPLISRDSGLKSTFSLQHPSNLSADFSSVCG